MRTAALLTIAMALAWTAGAQQAPAPKAQHAKLMTADTNKDGKVSFEELSAVKPTVTQDEFKRLDRNSDGFLSPADRAPKAKPGAQADAKPKAAKQKAVKPAKQKAAKGDKQDAAGRLKAADKNGDGRITPEEFTAAFPKAPADRFAKLDRDKDGALTPKDRQNEEKPGDARHAMAAKLQKADTNGDGKVTFEEASAAKPGLVRADFDRFDTNKDGTITKEDARKPAAGQGQRDELMKKLRAADTNTDTRVSWEEAQAAVPDITRARFDRYDRNKDGFIAKDDRAKP
ncbi:MAG: hypothetical protein RBU21_05665 [FCB group bacterium]|jgi:Ca2+-binding EF-hand superfamily protein|nr:hypothetical protein [FCB group bacterium]